MKTAKNFNELLDGGDAAGASNMQAFQSVENMSPSGWKPAYKQDLPPTEKGYKFFALKKDSGERAIAGYPVGETPDQAFFVSDVPHPILDDATAKRIVDGLDMKYRSGDERQERLKGG